MHIALIFAAVLSALIWGVVNLRRDMRRSAWEKKNITPLYNIGKPRELVATLAFSLLRCGGELTAEQKSELLRLYEEELKFTAKEAEEIYRYASYLISTDPNYDARVREICAPSIDQFSEQQRQSANALLQSLPDSPSEAQRELLAQVRMALGPRPD